ncbi:MAG TPA: proline racemase family protein [Actinomycetota bacterium]|nr:proline racemase family protein [Actinomycetota bacterium]
MAEPMIVTTTDYHTGGEPFRIVTGGVPPLEGRTILDKRRYAKEHLDDVRRLLVYEPRGHADMYGCFVTEPEDEAGDLGVVFFHNEGYSTACGHGTIALVTWALESGRVRPDAAPPEIAVDAPSGRLRTVARMNRDRVASVRFTNVPSFVWDTGVEVETSAGSIRCDISFGGAFYASVAAGDVGLRVARENLARLIELGREIKRRIESEHDVVHPLEPELRDVYGVIFLEDAPAEGHALGQRNVTIFADGEVDRSPCGSGTSARLALLDATGELARGATLRHEGIVGSVFVASVTDDVDVGGRKGVVTEVEGSAFRTGAHEFFLDDADPLGTGFLLR